MASVVSLFVSPGIGQPMQPRTSVRALAGRGLEGDRYALGQGSYSKLPRPAARHVSLIAREAMEASNEELSPARTDTVRAERDTTQYHCRRHRRLCTARPRISYWCRAPTRLRTYAALPHPIRGGWQDWICGGISRSGRHTGRGLIGWNYFDWRPHSDGFVGSK